MNVRAILEILMKDQRLKSEEALAQTQEQLKKTIRAEMDEVARQARPAYLDERGEDAA